MFGKEPLLKIKFCIFEEKLREDHPWPGRASGVSLLTGGKRDINSYTELCLHSKARAEEKEKYMSPMSKNKHGRPKTKDALFLTISRKSDTPDQGPWL